MNEITRTVSIYAVWPNQTINYNKDSIVHRLTCGFFTYTNAKDTTMCILSMHYSLEYISNTGTQIPEVYNFGCRHKQKL